MPRLHTYHVYVFVPLFISCLILSIFSFHLRPYVIHDLIADIRVLFKYSNDEPTTTHRTTDRSLGSVFQLFD